MTGEGSVSTRSWLYHPEFPDQWERRPLYSLAQWVNGVAFRDIQFSPRGKPVIKIAEIKGGISGQTKFTEQVFDESVHVRAGDLLFSWSGQPETSIDVFWWRGPDGWLNQHSFRVTPIEAINPTFFFYLLRYLKSNFVGIASNKQTTGLGHVTKRDLEGIEVGFPTPDEQHAIAHVLGTLDDKIELNRRMNETLEAMARALFKSWFVDFDPVHAKAEGRDTGLPADIAALFPDSFEDSELGEIPQGWGLRALSNYASLNPEVWSRGTRPDVIRYVDLSNTKWGHIDSIVVYQALQAPSRAQRALRPGDTVVGTVRPGNGSYALISDDGLTGSTAFAVLRPLEAVYTEYVYLAAVAAENIERLSHLADGGAYPAVRPDTVAETSVIGPGRGILPEFSHLAEPIFRRIACNERESWTLANTRDSLLSKLISGDLRLRDVHQSREELS
jgi:type I restriction enzyme S subunit